MHPGYKLVQKAISVRNRVTNIRFGSFLVLLYAYHGDHEETTSNEKYSARNMDGYDTFDYSISTERSSLSFFNFNIVIESTLTVLIQSLILFDVLQQA